MREAENALCVHVSGTHDKAPFACVPILSLHQHASFVIPCESL